MSDGNHGVVSRILPVIRRKGLGFFLAAGSLLLSACSTTTSVGDILGNPAAYEGKEVTVSGEVTGRTSLLKWKSYVLKDETGEIRVVTKRPMPQVGAQVQARGTVEDAFSFGSMQMIVLVEESDD